MFLLFIDDLPAKATHCTTALFADDSKCFKDIRSLNDCLLLQHDLDQLHEWSCSWHMSFNADNCKILSITRCTNPYRFNYCMNGVPLEYVGDFKDLGVVFDKTLSFNTHINHLIPKCNKVCGLIKRSIGFKAPMNVKLQLFKSLCLPLVDYCSPVWSPQSKFNIRRIESIQRSMTKYLTPISADLPYVQRLTDLHLLPLTFRREINDLLFLYKCIHGLITVDFDTEISYTTVSNRRFNGVVLILNSVRTETFMSSFFNRIVHMWNALPDNVRNADSFAAFKRNIFTLYIDKLPSFDVDNLCTWTTTCRCLGFYHF